MARHVGRVEGDVAGRRYHPIELGVAQAPAGFLAVPVFAYPVVLPPVAKVGGESTSQPRRRAFGVQESALSNAISRHVPTSRCVGIRL